MIRAGAIAATVLALCQPASAQTAPPGGGGPILAHPASLFISEFLRICTAFDGNPDAQEAAARSGPDPYLPARMQNGDVLPGMFHRKSVSATVRRDRRPQCSVGGVASEKITLDALAALLSEQLKVTPTQSGRYGDTPIELWPEFRGPGSGTVIASATSSSDTLPITSISLALLPYQKAPQ